MKVEVHNSVDVHDTLRYPGASLVTGGGEGVAKTGGTAEAWRELGRQLAASRRVAGLSQERLASLTDYSRSTIANTETGRQRVPRIFWERCDAVLGTVTALSRGYDEVIAVERRQELSTAAAAQHARTVIDLGRLSEAEPGPQGDEPTGQPMGPGQIESIRRRLTMAITGGTAASADPDAWEQTVLHVGQATRDHSPGELVLGLAADMAELDLAIRQCRSPSSLRQLIRVAANMAGLMCLLHVKLSERAAFREWAHTARVAAEEAGDSATASWVLAQEAYGHYYSGDLANAVRVAQRAQGLVPKAPGVGAALAAALEARAHAARGDAREAQAALGRAETILGALGPGEVTASAFGYTESQLRCHQSDTYTRLGALRSAWAAQERGLQICPATDYTDWALIRLDRATCLVRSDDVASAITYATETLTHMSAEQRKGIIAERSRGLLHTLSAKYRATTAADEIEELLSEDKAAKEAPDP